MIIDEFSDDFFQVVDALVDVFVLSLEYYLEPVVGGVRVTVLQGGVEATGLGLGGGTNFFLVELVDHVV